MLDQADGTAGLIEADQHEHRVERHRREGVDRYPVHAAVVGGHGDDGDPGWERAHRPAESAHVDGRDGHGMYRLSRPGRGCGGQHQTATGSAWANVSVCISMRWGDPCGVIPL